MGYIQGTSALWETPLLLSRGCWRNCIIRTLDHFVLQTLCQLRRFAFSTEARRSAAYGSTHGGRDGFLLAMPSGNEGIAPYKRTYEHEDCSCVSLTS